MDHLANEIMNPYLSPDYMFRMTHHTKSSDILVILDFIRNSGVCRVVVGVPHHGIKL